MFSCLFIFQANAVASLEYHLVDAYYATANTNKIPVDNKKHTVATIATSAKKGDILVIRAKVQATCCDLNIPRLPATKGVLYLYINDTYIGASNWSSQVIHESESHHAPLWAQGIYSVPNNRSFKINAKYRATLKTGINSPFLQINGGRYTDLLVEHYTAVNVRNNLFTLNSHASDTVASANVFGHGAKKATSIYSNSLSVKRGDILISEGMATSNRKDATPPSPLMHGQFIRLSSTRERISTFTTENNNLYIANLPVNNLSIYRPQKPASVNLELMMYALGDANIARVVNGSYGYLYTRVFRRANQGMKLYNANNIGLNNDIHLRVNGGYKTLLRQSIDKRANYVYATSHVQYKYPNNTFDKPVACDSRIRIVKNKKSSFKRQSIAENLVPSYRYQGQLIVLAAKTQSANRLEVLLEAKCRRHDLVKRVNIEVMAGGTGLQVLEYR